MRKFFVLILSLCSIVLAQGIGGKAGMGGKAGVGGGVSVGGTWTTTTITCAAQAGGGSTTSEPCTPNTNISSGSYIFVAIITSQTGLTYGVTDSNSDTFTSVGSQFTAIGNYSQLFWGKAGTTITSVTAQITGGSATSAYMGLVVNVATDSGATPALDGSQCTGSSSSPYTCGTTLTLVATDYVFCDSWANSGTYTAGSGFTLGSSYNAAVYSQYGLFSSSVTPSIASSSGNTGGILCAAFKP